MHYLHTMVRVKNLEESLDFYCKKLGLQEVSRKENEKGRFTLVFLKAPDDEVDMDARKAPLLELTLNWDAEDAAFSILSKLHLDFLRPSAKKISAYSGGRNFGHLAYAVEDIYGYCERLQKLGIVINRPPRDGRMAFICSPDGISIELLQKGAALEQKEPWLSMKNTGSW